MEFTAIQDTIGLLQWDGRQSVIYHAIVRLGAWLCDSQHLRFKGFMDCWYLNFVRLDLDERASAIHGIVLHFFTHVLPPICNNRLMQLFFSQAAMCQDIIPDLIGVCIDLCLFVRIGWYWLASARGYCGTYANIICITAIMVLFCALLKPLFLFGQII